MTAHTRSFDDIGLTVAPTRATARAMPSSRRRTRGSGIEYKLVFAACFLVFLAVLALEALLPRPWRKISEAIGDRSFLTRVRAAAHRYSAIAFQG